MRSSSARMAFWSDSLQQLSEITATAQLQMRQKALSPHQYWSVVSYCYILRRAGTACHFGSQWQTYRRQRRWRVTKLKIFDFSRQPSDGAILSEDLPISRKFFLPALQRFLLVAWQMEAKRLTKQAPLHRWSTNGTCRSPTKGTS